MKPFMDEDFLLTTETAKKLYHEHAHAMPILDYHCHLSPKEIWDNKKYDNITQVWLYGDHYKWRAMRAMGIDERYITGDASDYEKFCAWARTIPYTIGNPLYHWTHLELKRFFGIDEVLSEESADRIWNEVNEKLKSDGFAPQDLIEKSGVEALCTTDDPVDDLSYHKKLAKEWGKVKVLPAFRPDKAVEIGKDTFCEYIKKLEEVSGKQISSYNALLEVISSRMDFFETMGCSISDHGIEAVPYRQAEKEKIDMIFKKAISGEKPAKEDEDAYKTAILRFFAKEYQKRGWVMQIHMKAIRDNNMPMFEQLGPDTGYDAICDVEVIKNLSAFLNSVQQETGLPKTIFYSLNPNDNAALSTLMGCFQGGGIAGKMQLGSAWWFNDHKIGMKEQMSDLASTGLLSRFVGMLTDSRSFLSYPRHEYFRRILCALIGEWVENGEYPADFNLLGKIVEDVCYYNAKNYFEF
jgi:glucuronate isomerase